MFIYIHLIQGGGATQNTDAKAKEKTVINRTGLTLDPEDLQNESDEDSSESFPSNSKVST